MAQTETIPSPTGVPTAQGGPITDRILEQVAAVARRALLGPITEEEGALLLLTIGPLCEEVQQHRRRMEVIRDLADKTNVVLFPGAAE